jgi:hypothetical protein
MRARSNSATTPTGTFRKKMSRHDTSARTPPRTGPDDDARPPPIAHTPIARARIVGLR